jgi:predicted nuclease of predicted toxin-antitoxin system
VNLYLDDNLSSGPLAAMLTKQGHSVVQPAMVGQRGASDTVHLEYAIRGQRVMLTADTDDFTELHQLILTAAGQHPGILIVRFDNNSRNDIKAKHIAAATAKVQDSGLVLTNQLLVLSQWR